MLAERLIKYKIILASASPRRKELLMDMGLEFEVRPKHIDEVYPVGHTPVEVAEYLSSLKAREFDELNENELVISSDTIVSITGLILGKPANKQEATEMLQKLSGKAHEVITAVTLKTKNREKTFSSMTQVIFKPLTSGEIDYYIDNYKPFDKAGAYGIQEWIGYTAIECINGSYYNVVGLPTHQLYKELIDFTEQNI